MVKCTWFYCMYGSQWFGKMSLMNHSDVHSSFTDLALDGESMVQDTQLFKLYFYKKK